MSEQKENSYHWELYKQWLDLYKFYFDLTVKLMIWYFSVLGALMAFSFNQCSFQNNVSGTCPLFCNERSILLIPIFLGLFLSILSSLSMSGLRIVVLSIETLSSLMKIKRLHQFSVETLILFLFFKSLALLFIVGWLSDYCFFSLETQFNQIIKWSLIASWIIFSASFACLFLSSKCIQKLYPCTDCKKIKLQLSSLVNDMKQLLNK